MPIYPSTEENLNKAAEIIKSGGLVAFPTETVYGLGADTFNPVAVAKIFQIKKRPFFDPLIVHIADHSMALKITDEFNDIERKLAEKFWPGPLTLILKKKGSIPDIVTSGLPSVGIRMPAAEIARSLIKKSGRPIAAPSANLFGQISPVKARHVLNQLGNDIMIIDGGECPVGIESTIIKVVNHIPVILRHGGISSEEIKSVTGKINIPVKPVHELPESPGQLPFHYSPLTRLVLVDSVDNIKEIPGNSGMLFFKKPEKHYNFRHIEILTEKDDLPEAAARLFSCLHNLDSAGLDVIYAEKVPLTGLGTAIMDRLNKAAGRYNRSKPV